jgi:thioredoxin 2
MANPVHLICNHCASVNRVPQDRLVDSPKCGQCKQPILSPHPIALNSATFRQHLDRDELPMVADFWAAWCGPCQAMAPEFAAAAETLTSEARFFKIDTDAEPDIAGQFSIRSIPTLILFKGGREVARKSGATSQSEIVRWIRAHR